MRVLQQTMTAREFAEWQAEYRLRAEDHRKAEMEARVNARMGAHLK